MYKRQAAVVLAFVVGAWCVGGALAYERADLLPAADMRVWVSSVEGCTNAARLSPLWRLWNDKGFQNFLGHPDMAAVFQSKGKATKKEAQKAHWEWEEWKLLKGEVLVAVDGLGKPEQGLYLVAQISKEDYQKSLDLDRKIAELDQQKITHIDFQGQDVVQMTEKDSGGKDQQYWQTYLHNMVLNSNRRAWLEQTIARLKRDGAPVAGKADVPTVELTLSGQALVKAMQEGGKPKEPVGASSANPGMQEPQQAPVPGMPGEDGPAIDSAAVIKALGLDTLKTIKVAVKLEKAQTRIMMSVDRGASRSGLWTLFDTRPTPPTVRLPYLPPNVAGYEVGRLNLHALWNEVPAALTAINPMLIGMFAMATGTMQKEYGLDLDKDVLAHLDTVAVTVKSLQNSRDYTLVGWQLKNAEGLNATLKRLMAPESRLRALLADKVKTEEFRGVTLYTGEATTNLTIGVTVTGNMLYVGEAEQVRGVLRATAAGAPAEAAFYRSAIFQDMLRNKPDNASSYALEDMALLIKSVCLPDNVAMLKAMLAQKLETQPPNGSAGKQFWQGIDFDKLPPPERMASFFGPVFGFMTSSGDRLEVQWLCKYPEKR